MLFFRQTDFICNTLAEWRGPMCHPCVSSSPGCFVPATLFLLGKREHWDTFWTTAFAAETIKWPPLPRYQEAE